MADIQRLAEDGLKTAADYLKALHEMINGETLIDKEKVVAIKAGTEILRTIWDRAFPKLSSSKNTNVDVDFAKLLAAKFPPALLLEMQRHIDGQQEPKHVESESRPCP
jgi:hypothetical protein